MPEGGFETVPKGLVGEGGGALRSEKLSGSAVHRIMVGGKEFSVEVFYDGSVQFRPYNTMPLTYKWES